MSNKTQRKREYDKYDKLYFHSRYGMGKRRFQFACKDLRELPTRGSYLDVGCGKGEMLEYARKIGFYPVAGVEVLDGLIGGDVFYGEALSLPFESNSFDVVSLFDVLEHLIPGDEKRVCKELKRVAKSHILLTANNRPSHFSDFIETDEDEALHINIRSYDKWHEILKTAFPFGEVIRLEPSTNNLARWRVDL